MIKIYEMLSKIKELSHNDEYNEEFGEPTTEVLDIYDLLDFIDDVINFTENQEEQLSESINKNYDLQVDKVVATDVFEKALKILYKKHRTDVLKELKSVIIDLGNYKTQQKHNHPLKNTNGHMDIHIDGGNLVLLYRYVSDNILMVGFTDEQMQQFLKLQDLVNHKQLNRYKKKNYELPYHEFNIDKLDNDNK